MCKLFDKLSKKDSKEAFDEQVSNAPELTENSFFLDTSNPNDPLFNRANALRPTLCIEGYVRSATILIDEIAKSNDNLVKDSLLYPALHNIHQFIELILKDTISNYNNEAEYQRTHNLNTLWNNYVDVCSLNSNDNKVKIIGEIINEFNNLSDRSMAFRYPYTNNQSTSIQRINPQYLKERLLQVYRFLDGIYSQSLDKD